jgi:WS/DGAT C-terminal domain
MSSSRWGATPPPKTQRHCCIESTRSLAGCALNITVLSYVDRLDVGLIACPDIVDPPPE